MVFIGFVVFGTLIGAIVRMIAAGRAGSWTGSTLGGAAGAFAAVAAYNFMAAGRRARTLALERTKERS